MKHPQIGLRCSYCGETWTGSRAMIGKACASNPVDLEPTVECAHSRQIPHVTEAGRYRWTCSDCYADVPQVRS